jgi:hypothetical protein
MLLVCSASHFILALPLQNMLAITIRTSLNNIFNILPLPRYLTCDHQSSLAAVQEFCNQNDVLCIKSTPTSKNELGSIDVACKIATQFLQKITTSIDQELRHDWPRYIKILTDNLNAKHSNKNAFSRSEMFFGPIRFMPNQKLFASDIFDVCGKMLEESTLSQQRKEKESKRQAYNEDFVKISYPRNSIVKLYLKKNEKTTISGSKKLLPDTTQFFQVLRSGPTQVQAKNLSDNTIRTLKKEQISMVTYKENQIALRLIHENFPKSLLWEYNAPHMKQSKPVYIQHLATKIHRKKSVTFSTHASTICLQHMYDIEEDYLRNWGNFSEYAKFLKQQKIFTTTYIKTKMNDGQLSVMNIFSTLLSCQDISPRELASLYKNINSYSPGL